MKNSCTIKRNPIVCVAFVSFQTRVSERPKKRNEKKRGGVAHFLFLPNFLLTPGHPCPFGHCFTPHAWKVTTAKMLAKHDNQSRTKLALQK